MPLPLVATVPTACGIETLLKCWKVYKFFKLQQYLPLAVLKRLHHMLVSRQSSNESVATVPTACGIETVAFSFLLVATSRVATVPTACGIETCMQRRNKFMVDNAVATVPTACGIETC